MKPLQVRLSKMNYRGGLPADEKYRPLWLPDKEKVSVEVVKNG